jgi:galactosamine-6-phosphate isomerase
MNVIVFDTYEALSRDAAYRVIHELEIKRDLLLCAATGGSPTGMYACLADEYLRQPKLFVDMRVIKLDEWGNVPMENSSTCESYLRKNLLSPLNISRNRYLGFNSTPTDPVLECERIQEELHRQGPIDVCILGLGMNGHLALNEPTGCLHPHSHVAQLSAQALQHPMVASAEIKPAFGLTLGMADILQSKMIIILINLSSIIN